MKYLASVLMVLILIFLPELIVPIDFKLYTEQLHKDVVIALDKVINDEPYCIIAPRLVEIKVGTTSHSHREWIVLRDPLKIDARHVLDHAVRQKLIFYANEGRSLKRRFQIGSEMHFGLVKKDTFYIWSFKRNGFVKLKTPVSNVSYLHELKNSYITFSRYKHLSNISRNIDPIDYYCIFSYQ